LNKRENFRKAFNNFDYKKIALFRRQDPSPLRHRNHSGTNSKYVLPFQMQCFYEIQEEFGSFSNTSGHLQMETYNQQQPKTLKKFLPLAHFLMH
jgi:DNA-3-methyladenine glycosylase I